MERPAIVIRDVSKRYRVGVRGPAYQTLRDTIMSAMSAPVRALQGAAPAERNTFWALRDIALDIGAGEVLGLIGRNGAGKSTLLKILARITRPTTGRVELHGRVGSLLDIGTGFHPELTGRENAFLNGAILGMRHRDVRAKLDEIVEFAGIREFIDTPVKHYSSGMRVRLAFAVAAQLDTEILLADEVLTVGDVAFQKKCIERMNAMAKDGRTVVFVSHNMGAVGELCTRAVLLDHGRLVDAGRTPDVIRRYLADYSTATPSAEVEPPRVDHGMRLRRVAVSDAAGRVAGEHEWSQPFRVAIAFEVTQPLAALSLGITIVNQLGIRALFSWVVFQEAFNAGHYVAEGEFAASLSPGRYSIDLNAERYGVEYYHVAERTIAFEIVKTSGEFGYELEEMGLLYERTPWRVRSALLSEQQPS